MDYDILLQRLDRYGVRGGACSSLDEKFFVSYFNVNKILSSPDQLPLGFLRALFWVPFYFLSTYNNELPNSASICDVNMFAEDTELHYCDKQLRRVEQILQYELEQISSWMKINCLRLVATGCY